MVTADELTQIQRRMAEAGITNAGAYMRKMALNGYILHVDLAPVKELVSLQRRCANNLNQVAIHANTFGVYPEEIAGLQRDYADLYGLRPAFFSFSSASGQVGPRCAGTRFTNRLQHCCPCARMVKYR